MVECEPWDAPIPLAMDMTTMIMKAIATNAKLVKEDSSCVFKLLRGCKQVFFNADANITELLCVCTEP